MKYVNQEKKKLKKARTLILSCSFCKRELLYYQKMGKGSLLKLFVDRVITMEMPLGERDLVCPFCKEVLGHLIDLEGDRAYKMIRGTYQTKETQKRIELWR